MAQFKNPIESHQHSLKTLEILYGYDSFLDSLELIADFGCGYGSDTQWWATLETRDDPPEPREYTVYAIDKNPIILDLDTARLDNVHYFDFDFDGNEVLPKPVDFIWCHDTFQYMTDPLGTVKSFNKQLNVNGMLCLIFPQTQHYAYDRFYATGRDKIYFNHNIVNLIYMLAVNGFDCNDAYFLKEENSPWIHAAVYKTEIEPMDPKTTSWYQLDEMGLFNSSISQCLNRYGYIKQEELVTAWLDKDFHFPKE